MEFKRLHIMGIRYVFFVKVHGGRLTGKQRKHSLKYQSIMAADGIICHLYGPVAGSRHDSYLLHTSKLVEKLPLYLKHGPQNHFVIYGDPAYGIQEHILCGFKGSHISEVQAEFNKSMSSVRVAVEWGFGKILMLWPMLDFTNYQKLFSSPLSVQYHVATLLTNIHTCYNGSQTSSFFEFEPPTPQEYLRTMPPPEIIEPGPDNLEEE